MTRIEIEQVTNGFVVTEWVPDWPAVGNSVAHRRVAESAWKVSEMVKDILQLNKPSGPDATKAAF